LVLSRLSVSLPSLLPSMSLMLSGRSCPRLIRAA
jgi:hypothetical protein